MGWGEATRDRDGKRCGKRQHLEEKSRQIERKKRWRNRRCKGQRCRRGGKKKGLPGFGEPHPLSLRVHYPTRDHSLHPITWSNTDPTLTPCKPWRSNPLVFSPTIKTPVRFPSPVDPSLTTGSQPPLPIQSPPDRIPRDRFPRDQITVCVRTGP